MNLKLRIASFWMPQSLLIPEIDNVAYVTIECLDKLLEKYSPEKAKIVEKKKLVMKGDIEERRKIMATAHNVRVKALIDILGRDDAMKIGRKALFKAGLHLGQEARDRLGVGDSLQDLIRAARVLYRVLGIEFRIVEKDGENLLIVERCSLAAYYAPETCMVLSAADEGVVQGLNKKFHMIFKERMTEGPSECLACITIVINRDD